MAQVQTAMAGCENNKAALRIGEHQAPLHSQLSERQQQK